MNEPATSLSILVVDDEPIVAETIADLLRSEGHEVAMASSADEALQLEPGVPFHLVISDLLMPCVPGDELLRAMRARPAPAFWFAMMSSVPEAILRRRTTDYDRFVAKPLDLAKLGALVSDCAASPSIRSRLHPPPDTAPGE